MHLSLAFNPSHLEIVNPVVEGSVKARMDRRGDKMGDQVLPVLVHGDAAFAGQGVVMETLALAQTRGYYTGGTVHLVINNQIGFTTSDPRDSRSTLYCTDVVKMIEAPVLHVNGDDPEAVVLCTQLALDYRQQFNKDVVRRHHLLPQARPQRAGHAEPDAAADVQEDRASTRARASCTATSWSRRACCRPTAPTRWSRSLRAAMDAGKHTVDPVLTNFKSKYAVDWAPFLGRKWTDAPTPRCRWPRSSAWPSASPRCRPTSRCTRWSRRCWPTAPRWAAARSTSTGAWASTWPMRRWWPAATRCGCRAKTAAAAPSRTATRCCTTRTARSGTPAPTCRWSTSPTTRRRSSSSTRSCRKKRCSASSTATPAPTRTRWSIWEAQFGDFVNGAQVVIDQFIASGEVKWGRVNGLTLMLPHGYEGQGPEHSSARLERFMQLAADNNMQVVQPTSASQIFHLLRRQMVRQFRKPLVIMTPKSLLRAKDATSPLSEFTKGEFKTVIGPTRAEVEADKVKRVIACSGKVAYDLIKYRDEKKAWDVAILRVEQLYPFPHKAFAAEMKRFPERHRGRVVPGRAAEPGRLVLRAALHPREHERGPEARLCRPAGLGIAGGGLCAPAPGAAEGAARAGASASSRASC